MVKSSEVDWDEAFGEISAAYIRAFVYWRHVGRSIKNSRKCRRPKIDPNCGTPHCIF